MNNFAPPVAPRNAPPVDAIAAVSHPQPYPWYAALRNGPALHFDPQLRLWIASRADVVQQALVDPALRVRPAAEAVPRAIAGTPAGEVFGRLVRMNEGPGHAALKPALQAGLATLDLNAAHEQTLRLARCMRGEPLSAICLALPVRAVAHLLGFEDDALPALSDWMVDFVACLSPLSTTAQLDAAGTAAEALMRRFEALVGAQSAIEGSLVASIRLCAPDSPPRALLANLVGLLSQTCEASAGLLGNALVALAREPGLRRRIGTRWTLLPALIAEVARHDPAVHNTRRFVAAPTHLGGVALAPGDAVLLLLAAANRDPALNPAPATFELMRVERRSLGFGHGPHACPGEALACTIASAAVEALLSSGLDTDALGARGWDYRPSANIRTPVFR